MVQGHALILESFNQLHTPDRNKQGNYLSVNKSTKVENKPVTFRMQT